MRGGALYRAAGPQEMGHSGGGARVLEAERSMEEHLHKWPGAAEEEHER